MPDGLRLRGHGEKLYVTHGSDVLVVDRASLVLVQTRPVGGSVRRIAFRPDGVALVTNESGWVDFLR